MPAFLAALTAKLAGLGTLAKTAIATVAAMTMAAVGTAAVLPGADRGTGVVAQGGVQPVTNAADQAAASVPAPSPGGPDVEAIGGDSTPTPGSTSPSARPAAATPTAGTANLPAVPGVTLPADVAIPSCVTDLIPTAGTPPDPAALIAQLPACIVSVVTQHLPLDTIQSLIGSANLPVDISRCLSSVVASLPGFSSGDLSGLSQLLSSCVPAGFTDPGSNFGTGSTSGTGSSFATSSSGTGSSFGTSSNTASGSRRGSRSGR